MIRKLFNFASPIFFLAMFFNCSYSFESGYAVSSDNTSIWYKTFGKGEPLLIINGGPGMNSDGFEGLAIKLSENNQTIIYDQRGTGRPQLNVLDSTTINMQLMLDDIEAIRKKLNINKWSVLGHSFGGMVASYYAAQYPENIDKLVLSSSGGIDLGLLEYVGESINSKLSISDLDSVKYWTEKIDAGDTSHYARLERGKHLAPAYIYNKDFLPVIAERLTQGNPTVNILIWTDMQRIEFNCFDQLRSFYRPVLIIQGDEDIVSTETAERSHQAFKNSKIVYVEHTIHYGWIDNPEVYIKEVTLFLFNTKKPNKN